MVNGIIFFLTGLICILLPRTQWYKDYIEYHRHTTLEEIMAPVRKTMGWFFTILGLFLIISDILKAAR